MDQITHAVSVLRNGGIVIFPTDTAFGIGCRIDDKKAVERLFNLRRRPQEKATPILVDTVKMAQDYLQPIPQEVVQTLIEPYWPGALTIVLPCLTDKVPSLVRGGGSALGLRIPNHTIARAIIRNLGLPILGPSANFHGEATPFLFKELNSELIKQVDFVVEGECTIKQASTVINCAEKPWKILRHGAVRLES